MDVQELIQVLTDEQHARCCYGTRHGDGRTCDCKYDPRLLLGLVDANDKPIFVSSEVTGCPEFRQLIRRLELESDA